MKTKSRLFVVVDILLIAMMIIPISIAILIKILTTPISDGIYISGARIFYTFENMPIQPLIITESQINSWLIIISIFALCLYFTHGIKVKAETKRQHVLEWVIEQCERLVNQNMGKYFDAFSPFIAAVIALSAFSSLMSLLGLYPPTSDINVVGGWAILVFILITYYKLKCGPLYYLKGFTEPIAILTPMNLISEFATPVSMAFRHYGNVLSGTVISVLVATALQGLSNLLLGWLPGFLGDFPFLQIGIPAVLSAYFDVFSSCLQAYIFAMLTMMYIAGAFPADDYFKRKEKKKNKTNNLKTKENLEVI